MWPQQSGTSAQWKMTTQFPMQPEVEFASCRDETLPAKIRIRVGAWAAKDMPISEWLAGGYRKAGNIRGAGPDMGDKDAITFTLPITFRLTRYTGADTAKGASRYGLEYGPILMAVIGSPDSVLQAKGNYAEKTCWVRLAPRLARRKFPARHNPNVELMPYWKVDQETFTCLPVVQVT